MSDLPVVPGIDSGRIPDNGEWMDDSKGDAALFVEFYKNAVDGKDHVRIIIPGDRLTQPDHEATPYYQQRFRQQWRVYKGELDQFHGQTRIETVAWIDPGMIRDLKRAEIHTVELMASMGDGAIEGTGMIGLFDLRKRAQQHLAETAKSSEYNELKDENASLASQIKELQDQMQAQMEGQAAKAPEGQGRGPGRPRKVDA